MIKDKKVLAGGGVLLIALMWFYVKPTYIDSSGPPPSFTEEEIATAHRPTVVLGRPGAPGHASAVEPSGLVLNLKAPASSPNYVKAIIALEFADPEHKYVGASEAAVVAKNLAFEEALHLDMHKILDAVTATFGAKSADEVATPQGRERLKADLILAINAQLHGEAVEAIYFETFITQ